MTAPWLIIAGDLTPLGGMDAANHALARHLAGRGTELHVVAHRTWADLRALPSLKVHDVWRPFGRHLLGGPMLASAGERWWQHLRRRGARTIANGGNCRVAGANWVHYVHAAYTPVVAGTWTQRAKARLAHQHDVAAERTALAEATVVLCNSRRTARDVVERVGVPPSRVAVVYYGTDPERFSLVTDDARAIARERLGITDERPLAGFIGALGDRRKAFDTLFAAWASLCRRHDWDGQLLVAGAGGELDAWRARATDAGLSDRMTFLGFRTDVPEILAALDVLIHPARYEAYGLAAHEAICRGVPAVVQAASGIAERYPDALGDLLLTDPDDDEELAARLLRWRSRREDDRRITRAFAEQLRTRTWDDMATDIVSLVEQAA